MKALIYTINIINIDTRCLKKIIINILPLDKGVMVDYHTKKFFLSVIIYHNIRIHGQYIFYYTECVMISMFILFVVTTLFV
jgi:hypothetical protein